MKVIFPNLNELNCHERFEKKVEMVMHHLISWGFSSVELLSALVGTKPTSQAGFIASLIKKQYITRFTAGTLNRKDLVRIGPEGAGYIARKWGLNVFRDVRNDEVSRKSKLYHDYCLQIFTTATSLYCKEVIAGRHIVFTKEDRKAKRKLPDALLFMEEKKIATYSLWREIPVPDEIARNRTTIDKPDYLWVNGEAPLAIEFERIPKSPKALKKNLMKYFHAINSGHVKHIFFVYHNANRIKGQIRIFEKENWDAPFLIASDHPIRKCFSFLVYDEEILLRQIRTRGVELVKAMSEEKQSKAV